MRRGTVHLWHQKHVLQTWLLGSWKLIPRASLRMVSAHSVRPCEAAVTCPAGLESGKHPFAKDTLWQSIVKTRRGLLCIIWVPITVDRVVYGEQPAVHDGAGCTLRTAWVPKLRRQPHHWTPSPGLNPQESAPNQTAHLNNAVVARESSNRIWFQKIESIHSHQKLTLASRSEACLRSDSC